MDFSKMSGAELLAEAQSRGWTFCYDPQWKEYVSTRDYAVDPLASCAEDGASLVIFQGPESYSDDQLLLNKLKDAWRTVIPLLPPPNYQGV
jgi:hypothetical protein